MRKSDKKTEKALITSLKEACDQLLEEVEGFSWLTHFCDYSNFPGSLQIVCVFDTNEHLASMLRKDGGTGLTTLLKTRLERGGVQVRDIEAHIQFDTEEACQAEHSGRWKLRFS